MATISEMKTTLCTKMTMDAKTLSTMRNRVVYTKGLIVNLSQGDQTRLIGKYDWSGKVLGTYPPLILRDDNAGFIHKALLPYDVIGSKAAVIYEGSSNVSVETYDIAWLVAWHVPLAGTENKVYVECGALSKYKDVAKIDWETINNKLIGSGNTNNYKDSKTGAEVTARVASTSPDNVFPLECVFK